ncbi:MAG: TIGR02147 family protein, partial [Proteobacteria bacterium]
EMPVHLRIKRIEYVRLSSDQFHLISDWWHFGILNLVSTKGFKPLPSYIAERLGLPIKTVLEAWERLFRLGHLEKKGQKVVRKYPRIETTDDMFDLSIQKAHLEDQKLIEKSLLENPVTLRDQTSMTITMNKKDLSRAKELIRIFQDQFSDEIESTPAEEVYRLSIALFPLTVVSENT